MLHNFNLAPWEILVWGSPAGLNKDTGLSFEASRGGILSFKEQWLLNKEIEEKHKLDDSKSSKKRLYVCL